jgi:DNA helicase-2/ATP-dependent DNA helicase PcrA
MNPSVAARLAKLAPDQRAAATAAPGPLLCVAPAGSGKTTTLVARIAWLVDGGVDPATIAAISFNRKAAEELAERLTDALAPLGVDQGGVRVRTFHAVGREILAEAGVDVSALVDRLDVLRELAPETRPDTRRRLDTAFSRLKLDLRADPAAIAGDPRAGPIAQAFVAYERALRDRNALDFDDLVARALRLLESDAAVLATWRARCTDLLVDEAQDLDRSQLDLALLLAAPGNRIFLVGDDDQSIYGWRLADVRRVLGLAADLPGLRRVDLVTNYRCPAPVVERAVRLIEHNLERFPKRIAAGPRSEGRLVLAPDGADDPIRLRRVLRSWPADESGRAILARTNRELLPAVAVAIELELPFRAPGIELLVESPDVDVILAQVAATPGSLPILARLGLIRSQSGTAVVRLVEAMMAWAPRYRTLEAFEAAIAEARARLARLRRDDAQLVLATAHGTKGLEWDHVAVIGLDEGRFPSRRSLTDAAEPERALEEERRLAYVAWTRARRSLTLVYDPEAPSPFLLEAFSAAELGIAVAPGATMRT